jgi:hypothetical protein
LNLGRRPRGGSDRANVWHRYVAVGIHCLLRQHHEVTGSRTGLAWDEETTRLSLKDRDAHHIPDSIRVPPQSDRSAKQNNRNCLGCSLCCKRRRKKVSGNNRHLMFHQLSRQVRQSIVMIIRRARIVTPFYVVRFPALLILSNVEKIIFICLLVAFIAFLASWSKT